MRPEALRAEPKTGGGKRETARTPERTRSGAVVFLEAQVGAGTVTEVWRAHNLSSRPLAIKRYRPATELASQAQWLLEREALLLSRLSHPALVGTHGVLAVGRIAEADGRLSERPGLALEHLDGGDSVVLAGSHPRHWAAALRHVLEAVVHMHALGFVHGDVKARHVMFDARGRAKLIDLSSCLPVGAICSAPIGTPTQQRVRDVGHRVSEDDDVFASAALVYELIAGVPPFADDAARAALQPTPVRRREEEQDQWITDLLETVYGMLRSEEFLGAPELGELVAALARVEHRFGVT